jgi:hypothetical protein
MVTRRDLTVSPAKFFDNPAFLNYARQLRKLHELIRAGRDEFPEGESIREQMDAPAASLTPDEVDCLNAISADFYTLSEPPPSPQPAPADLRHRLKKVLEARDTGDFAKALDLLRQNEPYLDSAVVAFMRGRIWSQAGEHEIARDYFRQAKMLDSASANSDFIWLDALSRVLAEEDSAPARARAR